MAKYDRDFLNNEINIGDKVIFEAPNYRHLTIGTVITKAERSCQIECINTWNYSQDKKLIVRQFYEQILKHPDNIQAEDVEIVKHGKWFINSDGYYPYCSECHYEPAKGEMTKYCADCGARMDKK